MGKDGYVDICESGIGKIYIGWLLGSEFLFMRWNAYKDVYKRKRGYTERHTEARREWGSAWGWRVRRDNWIQLDRAARFHPIKSGLNFYPMAWVLLGEPCEKETARSSREWETSQRSNPFRLSSLRGRERCLLLAQLEANQYGPSPRPSLSLSSNSLSFLHPSPLLFHFLRFRSSCARAITTPIQSRIYNRFVQGNSLGNAIV